LWNTFIRYAQSQGICGITLFSSLRHRWPGANPGRGGGARPP
jgi:hypothetical protein